MSAWLQHTVDCIFAMQLGGILSAKLAPGSSYHCTIFFHDLCEVLTTPSLDRNIYTRQKRISSIIISSSLIFFLAWFVILLNNINSY